MIKHYTFLRIYHYVIEANLLYILVFLFYLRKDTIPTIIPFLTLVGGGAVLTLFLCKIAKNSSFSSFIISGIVLIGTGLLLNLSIELSIILSLFVCWRVHTHINEADKQHEVQVLLITFFSAIIIFVIAGLNDFSFSNIILLLTMFQIVFIVLGQFIQGVLARGTTLSESAKKQVMWMLVFLILLICFTSLLTIALPLIKLSFLSLIKGIFISVAYLFIPFLYFLLSQEEWLGKVFELSFPKKQLQSVEEKGAEELINVATNPGYSFFWFGLFLLLIIIGIIWYYRNYRVSSNKNVLASPVSSSHVLEGQIPFRFNKKVKPPKDYVRKLFYELEKLAAKNKRGRMKGETAEEWLNRIGLLDAKEMIKSYKKVRYNEKALSKDELTIYQEMIKNLKQQVKEDD